jgi:predicted permease
MVFYGVVSLILVLACANVAGLLLARNEARRREVAVRACIGASTGRIARQHLIEGLLLAALGGALGVVVGWFSRELVLIFMAGDVPPFFMSGIEPGVLLPIAVVILFSGLLFGLAPALNMARTDLSGVLRSTNVRQGRGRGGIGGRSLLVSAEIALALTVLTGANLMLKSVFQQRDVDPGFDADGIATVFVTLPDAEWQRSDRIAFFREALEKVRSLPGVDGAALASDLPTGSTTSRLPLWVGGKQLPGPGLIPRYRSTVCGQGYFAILGIPLIAGRGFDARDGLDNAPPVVIVNESFARRHWPGGSAVGKRVARPEGRLLETTWHEVVGVVGDVHNAGFGRPPEPGIYLPVEQYLMFDEFFLVKTHGDPRRILGQLREAIWDVSDDVPVSQLGTLQQEIIRVNWQVPTFSWAFGIISLIGLILAATGVYGIMAYSVSLRSREYALRMAVGAGARPVTVSVLCDGLTLICGGVATGVVLSLAGMQFLRDLLFRVSPIDMGAYGISVGMVIGVALLASYLPARRATRLDPVRILGTS